MINIFAGGAACPTSAHIAEVIWIRISSMRCYLRGQLFDTSVFYIVHTTLVPIHPPRWEERLSLPEWEQNKEPRQRGGATFYRATTHFRDLKDEHKIKRVKHSQVQVAVVLHTWDNQSYCSTYPWPFRDFLLTPGHPDTCSRGQPSRDATLKKRERII